MDEFKLEDDKSCTYIGGNCLEVDEDDDCIRCRYKFAINTVSEPHSCTDIFEMFQINCDSLDSDEDETVFEKDC